MNDELNDKMVKYELHKLDSAHLYIFVSPTLLPRRT